MTLTVVSLFAGIEGIGRAFHLAGATVTAAVEIDEAARGVIHDRYPHTTLFTDVCEVTPDELRATGFDPHNGVLVGGWPCQDLSVAGRRLGLGGARSGLFWEIIRLLDGLRPRWFCLENVPGLLSAVCCCPGLISVCGDILCCEPHPLRGGACGYTPTTGGRCMELHGGAMGAILGALAELGYGVAYRVLDAQYLGVPQRRRRVVLVGCLGDWAAPVQVLLEPEGGGRNPAAGAAARPGTAGVAALSASNGGADDNDATGGRLIAGPLLAGGADGRGYRVDAEGAASGHLVAGTLGSRRCGSGTTKQDAVATNTAVRRLTPTECERLQGFPDGWTATSWGRPQSDSARYRQLGNSVAVPVFEWVARRLMRAHLAAEVT